MSGGSYGYLYAWPDRGGDLDVSALRMMADRLDELAPGSAAARDTRAILAALDVAPLREVWAAVEWEDSSDGYPGQVPDAVAKYEATR